MTSQKQLSELICVEINASRKSGNASIQYTAGVNCTYCSASISVAHSSSFTSNGNNSKAWWNMSNFDRHLHVHRDFSLLENDRDCKSCSFFTKFLLHFE